MPHTALTRTTAALAVVAGVLSPLGVGSPAAAAEVRYRLTFVSSAFPSAETCLYSPLADVNESGWVVGNGATPAGFFDHGFLLRNGVATDLRPIGGLDPAETSAFGLNDLGDVVGQSQLRSLPDSPPHAVIWRRGASTPTDLGTGYTGSAAFSTARDVNAAGTVVGGRSQRQDAPETAVSWVGGRLRALPGLGGTAGPYGTTSAAQAIGEDGLIVGEALPATPGAGVHAVTWRNGVVRDLGTLVPGGEYSRALGVNDLGTVVGESADRNTTVSGFVWSNGVMRRLPSVAPSIQFASATAEDVNDSGVVIGSSLLGADDSGYLLYAATIWRGGVAKDLNTLVVNPSPGVRLQFAQAINDEGVIVGTAATTSGICKGNPRGFILTPTT